MNNKGFTLIELLAVIVILAIISGIATYGVISTINTSKLKSEKIFIDKLSNLIDDYLDLYPPQTKIEPSYSFNKCIDAECEVTYEATAKEVQKTDGEVTINDLITKEIASTEDLINPKNKKKCFVDKFPKIIIYKDTDYVYYYYVDLSGTNTNCDITSENGIINTLPDNLKDKIPSGE